MKVVFVAFVHQRLQNTQLCSGARGINISTPSFGLTFWWVPHYNITKILFRLFQQVVVFIDNATHQFINVFVDLLFLKYKCGNMSFSLVLLLNAAWGGWVFGGDWGPRFFPQQSESQVCQDLLSHRHHHLHLHPRHQGGRRHSGGGGYEGRRNNAKPLALCSLEARWIERTLTWLSGQPEGLGKMKGVPPK